MNRLRRRIDQPHGGSKLVLEPRAYEVAELLRMLELEDVDFRHFSEALAGNKPAAERILRTVQSIALGRGHDIKSLHHAVLLIGLRRVRASLTHLRHLEQQSAAATEAETC